MYIFTYPHFYSHLELRTSLALTSRTFLRAHVCVRACRRARTRALAHTGFSFDAAVIARRPARRQPGKLQARPYFVLSCCFSTRRKEMSEQTRHATPNLLISIHILWLLISSLLHSLSTRLPPFCFTSLSISLSFLSSTLSDAFSAILFFASPQFALYPSSRLLLLLLLVSLSAGFCPRFFFPLHRSSPLFHLPSNILP